MSSDRRLDLTMADGGAARSYDAPAAPVVVGTEELSITRGELLAGAQAGLSAGFAMGIMAIIVSLSYGLGIWRPFNDVAGAVVRPLDTGIAFNPGAVVLGIVIHFTISALLGVLFAAVYCGLLKLTFKMAVPLVVGVFFGLITWFAARYLFLPLIGTGVYGMPAFLLAHAIYGAVLGLLFPLMPARRV